ncbi:MAG: tyrosine-type recombinase/integrase [Rhizobiales bacterium]|nr:tyrosine-type recombinase/integrase [Hyphomicrobiales bacterium]
MRVRLKGINKACVKLADGTRITYWYAWRGGPRLEGQPGTSEFVACYNAAIAEKVKRPAGTLQSIVDGFERSAEYARLAPKTKHDYDRYLAQIETRFGSFPLSGLRDRRSRAIFKEWRDEVAERSLRTADYGWTVLARILSWAYDRGLTEANPCERGGRLYSNSRVDSVWTEDDENRFMAKASAALKLALMLAIWTGQRQGDLLRLPWAAYDGSRITLRQRKTGTRMVIPVSAALKDALDDAAKTKKSTIILTNQDGHPWTESGFRASWRKACIKASITGLTFHDIRGSAVTRLAIAGATEAEIASFTGHSMNDVRSILDAHYLHRDPKLAQAAIHKLEAKKRGTEVSK